MSYDEDDDDAVVPSGTRRSSYVPPTDGEDYIPSLPPVVEPEVPTASTGSVPTIAPANDDAVAQSPIFADSADIPVAAAEAVPPVIIEVPASVDDSDVPSRDQFGLPIVDDPIDIPQVVVTDPLPDAVSGTGTDTVFDDNRLFPPIVTAEETAISAADPESEVPEIVTSAPPPLSVPDRRSLTPAELADVLGANGGMSSNDQMALLDAQIPLREADTAAIHAFMSNLSTRDTANVDELIGLAESRFGDLAPELFVGAHTSSTVAEEFTDDSTPVTGMPVVTHTEIVDIVEDDSGDVVAVSVTEIDEVVVSPSVSSDGADTPLGASRESEQGWNLAAPADVVSVEPPRVERRRWWAVLAGIAVLASSFVVSVGATASQTGSAPAIAFVVAGLALAIVFGELARRGLARTGASWRSMLEETVGVVGGRAATVVVAVTLLVSLVAVLSSAMSGLGAQVESSALGQAFVGVIPEGSFGSLLVAGTLFGGALIAALPYRWFRAKVLVLTGWAAVGTAAVATMGGALLAIAPAATPTTFKGDLNAAGAMTAVAVVIGLASAIAFHAVSRVRDDRRGIVWLSIGLGLGSLVLIGTVVSALIAADGDHYFFGNNPVVHIIAPTTLLNVGLGAATVAPAVLLVATLSFRFLGSTFTRDDRDNPPALASWLLVLIPVAWGAIATVGSSSVILEQVPSFSVLAIPVAAIVGILAARGVLWPFTPSRVLRGWYLAVAVLVTVLAYGYASSDTTAFAWVGFVNAILAQSGLGILYIDALVVPAALVAGFILALIGGLGARRRATRVA